MAKWIIDPTHSEVHFKIRHLVISTVTGSFRKFEGEVEANEEDLSDAKIRFSADIASIDTNQEERDTHLRSADFFDADTYPTLMFESTEFKKKSDSDYTLQGNLTMHGVTRLVEFEVEHGGGMVDLYGQTKAGFDVTGKINRKDFGLTWNAVTEAGGLVVSEDVKLMASIQITRQA